MNIRKLREVLAVQTTSYDDALMRQYIITELKQIPGCEYFDDGDNIYAGRQTGPGLRACIVAHMDTVHDIVENLTVIESDGRLFGFNMARMEQTGIGGDDKVGVHIALEMIRHYDNIKVVFFRDEEVGCHGSELAVKDFFKDVSFVLQCDRRGNKDFVYNASGTELSSKAFRDDIAPVLKEYGYALTTGMMTDVMALKEGGIPVSMANMSCGYYNPHSHDEYVVIADVWNTQNMVAELVDCFGHTAYPHIAPPRTAYGDGTAFTQWDLGPTERWLKAQEKGGETNWWKDNECIRCGAFTPNMGRCDDCRSSSDTDGDNITMRHVPARHKSVLDTDVCADCGMLDASGPDGLCDDCRSYYKDHHAPLNASVLVNNRPAPDIKDREIYKKLDRLVKEKAQIAGKLDSLRKMDGVYKVRAYPPSQSLKHSKSCKCLECDLKRGPLNRKPDYGQTYYKGQWGKKKKKFKK